ncbi:unnamed protein product [Moneuplotes crassus]|uniref:Uncharacterized protein n=1 Tax=Euplotes crassus TaxID=5936 RepID=A0AAD1UKY7_EUPCR|nr:unnamed protein product [Moneuplotes crassus]
MARASNHKCRASKMGGEKKWKILSTTKMASSGMSTMHTANNLTKYNSKSEIYYECELTAKRTSKHISPVSRYIPILTQSDHRRIKNLFGREICALLCSLSYFRIS